MRKIAGISLAMVLVLSLNYCGGASPRPTVEPAENTVVAPAPVTEEPTASPQNNLQISESQTEKLPYIEPRKKSEPTVQKDENDPQDIMSFINSGITEVFKDFGYSEDVQVPEDFTRRIMYYIRYFSEDEKGSRFYRRAMTRGEKYFPMIKEIFDRMKLPSALIYLPVVESGFNTSVRSRAGAVGMWQFMKGTAKMYGLKVSRSIDERKDPEKATAAASKYLNDLLAMFGMEDPFLGICAYNAGEGKILNSLRNISYTERSFWTLVQKKLLRSETDEYIPRLMAVVLMNHNPKYAQASRTAIDISPDDEKEDEEIINSIHNTKDNLEEPKITRDVEEKPEPQTIEKSVTTEETELVEKPVSSGSRYYTVAKGDTLYSISKRYGLSVDRLKALNGLGSNAISKGQKLIVSPGTRAASDEEPVTVKKSSSYTIYYTVNQSDSLAHIALLFKGVSTRDIMRWNRLRSTRIRAGKKLVLHLKESPRKIITHVIKRGETASDISRFYKIPVEYVLSFNGLTNRSILKPGQRLKIYFF